MVSESINHVQSKQEEKTVEVKEVVVEKVIEVVEEKVEEVVVEKPKKRRFRKK